MFEACAVFCRHLESGTGSGGAGTWIGNDGVGWGQNSFCASLRKNCSSSPLVSSAHLLMCSVVMFTTLYSGTGIMNVSTALGG